MLVLVFQTAFLVLPSLVRFLSIIYPGLVVSLGVMVYHPDSVFVTALGWVGELTLSGGMEIGLGFMGWCE